MSKRKRRIWNKEFTQKKKDIREDARAKIDSKDDKVSPAQVPKEIIIMRKCFPYIKKKRQKKGKKNAKQMRNARKEKIKP